MRSFIRLTALAVLIATGLFWYTQGANTDRTRHTVSIPHINPVTKAEYTMEKPKFVPGIEFIGGSVAVVFALYSSSFLFSKPRKRRPIEPASIQEAAQQEAAPEETIEPITEPDSEEPKREDESGPKEII
jgi:hypothetical protein